MHQRTIIYITFLIAVGALLITSIYLFDQKKKLQISFNQQQSQIERLQSNNKDLVTEKTSLEEELTEANEAIDQIAQDLSDTQSQLEDTDARLNPVRDLLRDVADDVATQQKLASIDEELLQKYSNVYFLNENYTPSSLSIIPNQYTLKNERFHTQALPFLLDLLRNAENDGIDLAITSAYRSFDRQQELKSYYQTIYGEGANQFSADQGYSEHQLGTTVDFVSPESNNQLSGFGSTSAYQWLLENAYQFGFVLSYPEDNQFYVFEPWHWRFVGTELAKDLRQDNKFLFEYDERILQTYRLNLFD